MANRTGMVANKTILAVRQKKNQQNFTIKHISWFTKLYKLRGQCSPKKFFYKEMKASTPHVLSPSVKWPFLLARGILLAFNQTKKTPKTNKNSVPLSAILRQYAKKCKSQLKDTVLQTIIPSTNDLSVHFNDATCLTYIVTRYNFGTNLGFSYCSENLDWVWSNPLSHLMQ